MTKLETSRRRTQPLVDTLYQGMTLDAVTGLYYDRARDYSPSLGRWMEQDPAQYINGANTYQFVDSSPVGNVDAAGAQVYMYGVTVDNTPSPPQLQVWNDATAPWMLAHFIAATGNPVVITGGSFLRAVEGSWELKQEESQFKAQLLEKARAAATALGPGQSTTVRLDVRDFTYTMPRAKLNPFGRYLGFGEIHVNIDGSVNVRKDACGHVKYDGVIYFNGFDRYQWGTAMHSPNPWSRYAGDIINANGVPFNSYWNWTEPLYGELR
ncbi:MAG: RHS repeat-associated core domain-containing protein [Phycisphaerae bacterium]